MQISLQFRQQILLAFENLLKLPFLLQMFFVKLIFQNKQVSSSDPEGLLVLYLKILLCQDLKTGEKEV